MLRVTFHVRYCIIIRGNIMQGDLWVKRIGELGRREIEGLRG